MKKFLSLFAAILFAGSMMADSFTVTFKDNGAGKGDSSTSLTSTVVTDYVAEGADLFSAVASAGKVYNGQDGYGLKFGNSSNPGSITLTLATAIKPTSIVMNASPWAATEGAGLLQDSVFETKSTGAKGIFGDFTYYYDGATEITTIIVGTSTKRGYVKSITINYESGDDPQPTVNYYLVGSMTGWAVSDENQLTPNNEAQGQEFMGEFTFAADDEFKVVGSDGTNTTWYPDGDAGNYTIEEAGDYTVYFRPNYDGGEDWHYNCIYAAKKEAPVVVELQAISEAIVWDFSKITANTENALYVKEGIQLTGESTPTKNEEMVYANYSADFMTFAEGFDASTMAFKGEYPIRKDQFCQSGTLHFKTTVAGTITVKFSDTGTSASATAVKRYLVVNGEQTEYWTSREKTGDDPYDAQLNVTSGEVAVEAGDVTITGSSAIVVYNVTFAPAAPVVEPTLADGFYLIGQNGWNVAALSADLLFTANPDNEGEYVLTATLAENDGVKVVKVENDAIVAWYPEGEGNEYKVDAAHAGEKAIYFQETYKADWDAFGGYFWMGPNEEPATGCDWDAIDFLGDGSAEQTHSNQFKVCKVGEQPNVVNIQTPGFAAESGIYVTFPSAVFGNISLAEGQYAIDGAGIVLYCSAFTQEYTEVTVNWDGNDIVFTVYNAAAAPQPVEHTYTVAGGSDVAFGTIWDPSNTANDMALVEGLYTWEKTELTLAAGSIGFKVCEDHAWTTAYPAQDYQLNIPEAGIYTITITFNADTKEVNAVATKTGEAEIDPTVSVKGGWDSWAAEVAFTLADNKETATGVLNLEAGNYEFKVILNGSDWRSNGYTYHRDFTGAEGITGNGDNMVLQADAAGDYTITWTFANNAIAIVFPTATAISNTAADAEAVKVLNNGMLLIRKGDKTYTIMGQAVK